MSENELPSRWLLLRGLAREARHWGDFPERLSGRLQRPCTPMDLPGMGQWASASAPTSVPKTARMLAERMANEFPHDTWGVLSISLGGMVALALASLLPMRVSRLVLVNASSRLSPPSQRLLPAGRRQLLKAARVRGHHERERLILGVTTDPGRREFDDWVQHAAAISRHTPASPRAVARQLLGAARFYPPRVEQPTLVLSGAKDKLVSPSCSTALAHYLHAPHHIHPTAGHDLPLEEPVWVVAQIATWLGLGQAADTLEISRCETSVPQPPATGPRGEPHY